jgi:hypothetical protein
MSHFYGLQFLTKAPDNACGRIIADAIGAPKLCFYRSGKLKTKVSDLPLVGTPIFVNYGIGGKTWNIVYKKLKQRAPDCVFLNPWTGINKYDWVKYAGSLDIPVPDSLHVLNGDDINYDNWIAKPYYSFGGRNIGPATNYLDSPSHYYQRFIKERRFEVRVSFFKWLEEKHWLVWKRVSDDPTQITWNRHQGGRFITVKKPLNFGLYQRIFEDVRKITANSVLAFGAVDFVVAKGNKHYFLEVNTTPGFSCDPTRDKYIASFKSLLHTNPTEVRAYARG